MLRTCQRWWRRSVRSRWCSRLGRTQPQSSRARTPTQIISLFVRLSGEVDRQSGEVIEEPTNDCACAAINVDRHSSRHVTARVVRAAPLKPTTTSENEKKVTIDEMVRLAEVGSLNCRLDKLLATSHSTQHTGDGYNETSQ